MFIRSLICLSACVCAFGAHAVSLSRCDDGSFEVKNGHYGIHLSSSSGYAMTKASCGGAWFDLKGGFACALDKEPRVWRDAYMAKPEFEGQSQVKNAKAEVLEESPSRILIVVRWELKKGVEVVQKLAFDDSARIGVEHTVTYPVPLHSVCYSLTSAGMVPEKTKFFPENRHLPGAIHKPYCYAAPNWKFMSDGERGVGLVAPDGNGWDRFEYASLIKTTRWAAANELALHHAFMGHEKKGAAIMRFALVLTKDTAVAGKIARTMLAGLPKVELVEQRVERVLSPKGGKNAMLATLVNNTALPVVAEVRGEYVWDIDKVVTLPSREVRLAPGEMRPYRIDWRYPHEVEWGVAARLRVFVDGKETDFKSDICSVSDFPAAATGVGIINANQAGQDGCEVAWADHLRRSYKGVTEYYCWAPSSWDPTRKTGLSPVADEWDVRTEHPLPTHLTKRYLKKLVDEAHKRGVSIHSWITGLVNYQIGMKYPKMLRYTEDGQPSVYNGRLTDGKRFATVKLTPYNEKDASDWGDQMADSVDMFGWDGCRWDWTFRPVAPNDPYYTEAEMAKNYHWLEWFDWRGESVRKLYPNPDKTGAECVKAWRKAVSARHPSFTYATNLHLDDDYARTSPEYVKATSSGRSLILFEYLLGFNNHGKTFGKWGEAVAKATERVRENGGQTEVGFMRGVPEGTVSERLARHVCHAAGCKWWGSPDEIRYWGAKRRTLPFAIRFAKWFYSNDYRRLALERRVKEVKVRSSGRLLYEPFIYERRLDGGARELVVHIVNVDPDAFITMYNPEPKTRDDVMVEISLAEGERIVGATAFSPGLEPKSEGVPVEADGKLRLPPVGEMVSVAVDIRR